MSYYSSSSTPTIRLENDSLFRRPGPTSVDTLGGTLTYDLSQCSFQNSFDYSLETSPKSVGSTTSTGDPTQQKLLNIHEQYKQYAQVNLFFNL